MAEPIRLALVITELEPGGAERCLVHLATRIDRTRFAPVVYSIRPRPPEGRDSLVGELAAAGVEVRFADIRSKWQSPWMVGNLTRLLRRQRPQIVQNFLYHANVVGTLAAHAAGVPHALMGIRVADPRRMRSWLERRLARDVARIVCVSQSVADFCRARHFPSDKLEVIPNGVDANRFADVTPLDLAEMGMPHGRKAILFIGRLHVQKELHELIAAAPRMLDQLPEHDLVIAGEGPQQDALRRLASELEIASRVHFAGWRADVPALLAAAEMLVLPSRWEGMPNVVLEAMAAGKPVVATRAEGVVELLGELANEQTVAVGDMECFTERIVHFVHNAQLSAEIGLRNRDRVLGEFSLQAMIGKYEQLYTGLLAP
jgi:glycosyltransferase involved in cell wall biosynthesis